jgi:hypothetical protein
MDFGGLDMFFVLCQTPFQGYKLGFLSEKQRVFGGGYIIIKA